LVAEVDGLLTAFVIAYQPIGVPFIFGYVVIGVAAVMTARYTTSFVIVWFRAALRTYYIRDLQMRAYDRGLDVRVEYFDEEGSDNILNAIITQTNYVSRVIDRIIISTETQINHNV